MCSTKFSSTEIAYVAIFDLRKTVDDAKAARGNQDAYNIAAYGNIHVSVFAWREI